MFKLVLIFVVALSSFGCAENKEVSITMERDGDVTLMNQDDIVADFAKTESLVSLVDSFKDVDFDVFMRVDVESNVPLYHIDGDEDISGDLRLRGSAYRCDGGSVDRGRTAFSFRNEKNQVYTDNYYSFLMYVPFISGEAERALLASPPVDICIQIKSGKPNRDPYLNGSTGYTSNVITVTADELESVLMDYEF